MKFVRFARVTALALVTAMAVSSASAETLTRALASAYTNSPEILAAFIDAQASAEDIVSAKAGLMPSVNATAGIKDEYGVTSGANALSTSFGLAYTHTLFDNGITDASVEAKRAAAEIKVQTARQTEQTVLYNAADAYISVALNTRIAALRQDTVDFFNAQVQAAKDRLSVGEGTSTTVSQSQAQLASALSDQQSALSALATAQANYVRYMGHTPSGGAFEFPFEHMLPTSLADAIAIAEQTHPSMLLTAASVRAAKAGVDAAAAAYGPSLSLSGNVAGGTSFATGGTSVGTSVSLSLKVPIYNGGVKGSSQRKANLSQISAEMSAQNTHDLIVAQITSAWSSLRSTAAIIAAVQAAENASQKVLDAVTEEFGVGQKTQLDVLDAKSDLTTIQINKLNAESGRMKAALGLLSAIGRMSASDLNLPVEVRTPDAYRAKVEDVWQNLRAVPN